nr:hypothetical protein [Tanacetum cinerariifolium]
MSRSLTRHHHHHRRSAAATATAAATVIGATSTAAAAFTLSSTTTPRCHPSYYHHLAATAATAIEDDDQAIQTILLGLPEDIYAAVDSCETAQEIWLRVQQMMKGSDIRIQEKKAKLFNEWERFTSNEGELIESYYHRFLKLMNDLKRNKHFPEKIANDYTQLYDFLKYNQKEVDELKAERIAKNQDPLALIANSNNSYNLRVQNVGNQNGLIGVQGNGNQNQIGNGNLVAARAEENAAGQNGNQIRCYNCRGV